MKFKTTLVFLFIQSLCFSQPNWSTIKDTIAPQVMLTSEYNQPYKLTGTLGWEDGQYITRDGLTIYCYYTPLDLLSFANPPCGDSCINICNVSPYRRGPYQEILDSVPPVLQGICNEFSSSDILWSHRNSLSDSFPVLTPMNIRIPAAYEGAPVAILNSTNSNQIDYFVFAHLQPDSTLSSDNTGSIYWIKNTGLNPTGNYTPLPPPVNTDSTDEDNPHLEKLPSGELVLFFTSHNRQPSVGDVDIYVTTSANDGQTWSMPQLVNFNTPQFEDMPHLWQDSSGTWWLYYMNQNNEILRRPQVTQGNWVDWGTPQTVIGKGNAYAVGEPTLTQWGDIVFGLIYDAGTGWGTDTTNRFDDDFWILPKKGSPLATGLNKTSNLSFIKIYPNPTKEFINISSEVSIQHIKIRNTLGQELKNIRNTEKNQTISLEYLPTGLYFIEIKNQNNQIITKKIIRE